MEKHNEEKIVDKIKKLLALSMNNPSSEEAATSALMAQKLMAKHNIDLASFEETEAQTIEIVKHESISACAWKTALAKTVADNFRCKTFTYGKKTIAFYGRGTDAQVASEVFGYLFNIGHKLAMKARADQKKSNGMGDGAYNSFALGFVKGVRLKLEEQCTALMLIIEPEVVEAFGDFIKGAKQSSNNFGSINPLIYGKGVAEGKVAMAGKAITG